MDANAAQKGPGPVIFYWHGTGSNPGFEVPVGLGPAVQAVVSAGGIVAGPYSEPKLACPNCTGIPALGTGNGVWFKKDFETADEVLACAIEQLHIDTRRLFASGMSAGGLQVSAMASERSNYLASVVSYSGGAVFPVTDADPSNKLPIVLTHGGVNDMVIIKFKTASENLANAFKPAGHFVVICDHGRGHTIPTEFGSGGATWEFFQTHPYGVAPEPWLDALPADYPKFCTIW
jgi:predicted esterase